MSFIVDAVRSIFGGGEEDAPAVSVIQAPTVPTTPAPKAPTEADTLAAQQQERQRMAAMKGKTSNLATAGGWKGLGESEEDDQFGVAKKKLLG